MIKKEKNKCEAKYGDKRCENYAKTLVVSGGRMFNLCTPCARLSRKQNKLNYGNEQIR